MPIPVDDTFADDQIPSGSTQQPCCSYSVVLGECLLANQYFAVRVTQFSALINGPIVSLCGNGQKPIGILQEPGAAGDVRQIMVEGKSKAVIGQDVTWWTNWQSNAAGQLIPLAASSWSGGRFLEAASQSATPSGLECVTVLVGCHNPWRSDSGFTDEAA